MYRRLAAAVAGEAAAGAGAEAAGLECRLSAAVSSLAMNSVTLEEPGRFTYSGTAQPDAPGPGEVLVRVLMVGVCGTDLHAFEGTQPFFTYPRILGHELAVEVIETGDGVEGFSPGDRCAVNPYMTCGVC